MRYSSLGQTVIPPAPVRNVQGLNRNEAKDGASQTVSVAKHAGVERVLRARLNERATERAFHLSAQMRSGL